MLVPDAVVEQVDQFPEHLHGGATNPHDDEGCRRGPRAGTFLVSLPVIEPAAG